MARLLDPEERASMPNGWHLGEDGKAIKRAYRFDDFTEAFAFMTRVALLAEVADHHPDWSNSYNRVEISLSTHSAGGITSKDYALAKAISAISPPQ